MNPTPPNWPRISSCLYYEDAARAIDWLCEAFGFEVQLKVEGEGGRIEHSELRFGDGLVMVGSLRKDPEKMSYARTPTEAGGNTQILMVYVDDVSAHMARAKSAGAVVTTDMRTTDYGSEYWSDKAYECRDLGGHHWWFAERLRTGEK